jgi:hypothetical protein
MSGEVISGLIPMRSALTTHAVGVRTRHTQLTSWTATAGVFAENIAQLQEFWECGNVPYRRDKPMTSVLKPGEIRARNLASNGKNGFLSDRESARTEEGGELAGRGGAYRNSRGLRWSLAW